MKALKITQCNDGMRWYANLVGSIVPNRGYAGKGEYMSTDSGGYTNFVQSMDCELVEITDVAEAYEHINIKD
jgi:hypothetical protein